MYYFHLFIICLLLSSFEYPLVFSFNELRKFLKRSIQCRVGFSGVEVGTVETVASAFKGGQSARRLRS